MVTTNSPYTRTTWVESFAWNEIIQEVNDLAINPDEGCDPVEILEEVREDYIWNKRDIENVQDKLIEICPNNEFTELLDSQPWTSVIIDEIIEAIDLGWCECGPEELGTWNWELVEVGHNNVYCGGYVSDSWFDYWPGVTFERRRHYYSPCPGEDTNQDAREVLQNTYDIIVENIDLWIENRREELLEQRKVEDYSAELKSKQAVLENLEDQLAACQSDCSSIVIQITQIEEDISELEDKIQEAKDKRDAAKEKADENLLIANEEAVINWEAAQLITTIIPWGTAYVNLVEILINVNLEPREKDEEIEEDGWGEWGLGAHPYATPRKSQGTIIGKYNANLINYRTLISCTPNGFPFTQGPVGKTHGLPYYRFATEWRSYSLPDGWTAWTLGDTMVTYAGQTFAESIWERPTLGYNNYVYERRLGTGVNEEYDPDPDQEE